MFAAIACIKSVQNMCQLIWKCQRDILDMAIFEQNCFYIAMCRPVYMHSTGLMCMWYSEANYWVINFCSTEAYGANG